MNFLSVLKAVFGNPAVVYLSYLILANLLLGVAAAAKAGTFQLTSTANFLGTRVLPLVLGYGAASLLAVANPQLGLLRDAATYLLGATLAGYIAANLKDLGVPIPASMSAKDLSAALLLPLSALKK